MSEKAFFVTIPHSGERVPPEAPWLQSLPEPVLMCDVDRYVDRLYEPALHELKIPFVKTEWHRYAGDLNRVPEDVDASTVQGHSNKAGLHARGFLWAITTTEIPLMSAPVSPEVHQKLVQMIYEPFHASVRSCYEKFKSQGATVVYHLDAHSMPSTGTRQHRDPGEKRADIVVSDCLGKSCGTFFRDLVIASYCTAGFKVGYNWPYMGGRVSEQYGQPDRGQQALQVELNRSLYMDETSKKERLELWPEVQKKIAQALKNIRDQLPNAGR